MTNEIPATIVGNLTADPELRFLPSGVAVANFTVAQTPRVKNGDDWVDGEAIFLRCAVWREVAENIAESLRKGDRVIAQGRLKTQTYTPKDGGADRLSLVFDVEEIGHTLRWGTSQFTRAQKSGGGGQQRRQQPAPGGDPWADPPF
jgi:single-strand DNA-binding protein